MHPRAGHISRPPYIYVRNIFQFSSARLEWSQNPISRPFPITNCPKVRQQQQQDTVNIHLFNNDDRIDENVKDPPRIELRLKRKILYIIALLIYPPYHQLSNIYSKVTTFFLV